MKRKNVYRICGADIILMAVLAAAAVVFAVLFALIRGNKTGNLAVVSINGEAYGSFSLSDNQLLTIETEYGWNQLQIRDGSVQMADADCKDRYCVLKGSISGYGETIVCLPHRLVIELLHTDVADDADGNEHQGSYAFDAVSE